MYPLNVGLAISSPRLWEETQRELQGLPVRIVFEQAGVGDLVSLVEKIERFRPDVLLIDPGQLSVDLADLLATVKNTAVRPFVIIVRETASPDDILRAIRAGANEYLYSPLSNILRETLERVARSRENDPAADSSKARTIGFLSAKGGCGATTIACHSALELGQLSGKHVLLADFDFAAGLIRILMQVKSRYSLQDAVHNTQRLDASYWRGLVSNGFPGLEVIAASSSEIMREYPAPSDVRNVLRFARAQYDFVLADLGHGLDPGDLGLLEELDELILVTTPEMPALQMTKVLNQQLSRLGFRRDRIRLVLNRMSRRVELDAKEIESAIGIDIYASMPNDFTALDQAYSSGRLLPEKNQLRESIRRLVRRLADLGTVEAKKKFSLFG